MNTHAIILAAGQGMRLRPLTNDRPKCLVELCGKPLLIHQLSTLEDAGVSQIHIVSGYQSEMVKMLGYPTSYNVNYQNSNMVTSLFCAEHFFNKNKDLIISYGDIIYEGNNLQKLIDSKDEISVVVDEDWRKLWDIRMDDPLQDAETMRLDSSGFIRDLGKKPKGYHEIEGQYIGLLKIRSDKVNDFIDYYHQLDQSIRYGGNDFHNMYLTSLLQMLIDDQWKVKAVQVNNGWIEVDTINDLKKYESLQDQGKLKPFIDIEPA